MWFSRHNSYYERRIAQLEALVALSFDALTLEIAVVKSAADAAVAAVAAAVAKQEDPADQAKIDAAVASLKAIAAELAAVSAPPAA